MPAYVIGNLREVQPGRGGVEYLARIDATLEPYGGRYLVHGAPPEVLEGEWSGDTIVLEFPDTDAARAWYESDAYRAIKEHRTSQYSGAVLIIDGVPSGHRGADLIPALEG